MSDRNNVIRAEILLHLYAVRPHSVLPISVLHYGKRSIPDLLEADVKRELQFLVDDGCVEALEPGGSTEWLYKLTSKGVKIVEQRYPQ
jgi:hypothetical protein